jgi:hypothetical protein
VPCDVLKIASASVRQYFSACPLFMGCTNRVTYNIRWLCAGGVFEKPNFHLPIPLINVLLFKDNSSRPTFTNRLLNRTLVPRETIATVG